MKRKVIKQANQAYTITLPINWVRQNKIGKDSELEVEENGRNLFITNSGEVIQKKIKLDVSSLEKRNLFRHINALYAAGYDEIELISNSDISSKIAQILNSLIGYVLVSQSKNTFVIKDVGGIGLSDLDEIFKRVFQSLIIFYDSAIKDIFGDESETESSLKNRDLEVNKLCLYLQRAINKFSYSNPLNGRVLFTYSYELEKIGDAILHVWRENIGNNCKKTKELKDVALLSKKCLEEAFDSYYAFNSKNLEKYYDTREEVRKKVSKLKDFKIMIRNMVQIAESSLDLSHLNLISKLE